jgi:hypothetical protein
LPSLILSAAQAAGAESWLDSLGPFLPFGALAMVVIGWLAKKLTEAQQRINDLSDRAVETRDELVPLIVECTRALEEQAREARRRDP